MKRNSISNRARMRAIAFVSIGAGIATIASAQITVCASVALSGTFGNGASPLVGAKISANGRYACFRSEATNLTAESTNGVSQVFVKDLVTGAIEMVSLALEGTTGGNGESSNPSISADGRFVAFTSHATNLTATLLVDDPLQRAIPFNDANGVKDVYVRDLLLKTTAIVSLSSSYELGNAESDSAAISANGLIIAFRSMASNLAPGDTNGKSDVYARNMSTGITALVSGGMGGVPGNGESGFCQISMSADGQFVGFTSSSSNLVPGDTNGADDVFLRRLGDGAIERVSVKSGGAQGNGGSFTCALSANNRYVAFTSFATNLVAGDSNGERDVFVRDLVLGVTTRISVDSSGRQGNGMSGGTNSGWGVPSISGDGRYVAFQSAATNLSGLLKDRNNVIDVFVRDRTTNKTTIASVTPSGFLGNGASEGPSLSDDGLYLLFFSVANNLVAGDTNGHMDVFVRGPAR